MGYSLEFVYVLGDEHSVVEFSPLNLSMGVASYNKVKLREFLCHGAVIFITYVREKYEDVTLISEVEIFVDGLLNALKADALKVIRVTIGSSLNTKLYHAQNTNLHSLYVKEFVRDVLNSKFRIRKYIGTDVREVGEVYQF